MEMRVLTPFQDYDPVFGAQFGENYLELELDTVSHKLLCSAGLKGSVVRVLLYRRLCVCVLASKPVATAAPVLDVNEHCSRALLSLGAL